MFVFKMMPNIHKNLIWALGVLCLTLHGRLVPKIMHGSFSCSDCLVHHSCSSPSVMPIGNQLTIMPFIILQMLVIYCAILCEWSSFLLFSFVDAFLRCKFACTHDIFSMIFNSLICAKCCRCKFDVNWMTIILKLPCWL